MLSDPPLRGGTDSLREVLMHLLVLGAFWLEKMIADLETRIGLNAASGAGCFLTQEFNCPAPAGQAS